MRLRGESGFTLMETVVGLVVMTLMITAVGQLFVSNLQVLTVGKAHAIGLQLANEQMEKLRDLPYQSLATVNGAIYPPGSLADNQTLVRGGYTFNVKTEITYVDDPYDGNADGTIAGKPVDTNPGDYRKAQITVRLRTAIGLKVAQLTTDIAGKAAETTSNTGVISVKVLNAAGQPVPNASVHIYNPAPNPDVDITTNTDNLGFVAVPDLPLSSTNGYQVTASLAGYSTDGTIPDPAGAQTAVEQNLNVLAQQVTALTLSIDQVSTMNVTVVDTAGNPVVGKAVTITGAKKTKLNPDVFKYSQATTTDSAGKIALTGMEFDSYSFAAPAGYYLVSTQPFAAVAVQPNASQSITLVLSTSSSYPRLATATPTSSPTGTNNVALKLTGNNLTSATTITLRKAGQSDITASSVVASGGNTILNGNLNISSAATGAWDIVVTNASGTVTQPGAFNVTP